MKFPVQFRELSHRTNLMYVRPGRDCIEKSVCGIFFSFSLLLLLPLLLRCCSIMQWIFSCATTNDQTFAFRNIFAYL